MIRKMISCNVIINYYRWHLAHLNRALMQPYTSGTARTCSMYEGWHRFQLWWSAHREVKYSRRASLLYILISFGHGLRSLSVDFYRLESNEFRSYHYEEPSRHETVRLWIITSEKIYVRAIRYCNGIAVSAFQFTMHWFIILLTCVY